MQTIFLFIIAIGSRTVTKILKALGYGGTSLPGLWVEKYAPGILSLYASYYSRIVFVTGTNGKTTTQLTLRSILVKGSIHVVNNHSGSNMLRGVATTILSAGVPPKQSILLCEVEEATMPMITKYIKPHLIVITNLFRDQLDAYGELHKTAAYLIDACQKSPDATIVANVDDPMVDRVLEQIANKKTLFSLGELRSMFAYEGQTNNKAVAKKAATYIIRAVDVQPDLSTKIMIMDAKNKETVVQFQPPGIYNVYNMLAAFASACEMGIDQSSAISGIQDTKPPFGRGEKVVLVKDGKTVHIQLFLVKNPAGFSQVWHLLMSLHNQIDLVLGLNDNVADGRDVSWIWDIDLNRPQKTDLIRNIYFTGKRAFDMALRYKYAGIDSINTAVIPSIERCLEDLIQKNNNERECYFLMTYTAINQMREALGQYVNISPYLS